MDNSAFRNLVKEGGATPAPKSAANSEEAKAAKAAKAAARKAAYDKRMELQAKRQEKLAEESKYVDRASLRRKELAKSGHKDEAPPLAGIEPLLAAAEGRPEHPVAEVPVAPTFAQVGAREDLSQQQHRLSIDQSKFLGGDIEHTHLVKGLDFALLQKRRAELAVASAAAAGGGGEAAGRPGRAAGSTLPSAGKASGGGGAKATRPVAAAAAAAAAAEPPAAPESEMARAVLELSLSGAPPARPNRSLTSGRLLYVYSLDALAADTPNSLVRAEDDLTIPRRREKVLQAATSAGLLSKLSKVLAYCARPSGERARKSKKEKDPLGLHLAGSLSMTPLPLPSKAEEGGLRPAEAPLMGLRPAEAPSMGGAGRRPSRWGPEAEAEAPPSQQQRQQQKLAAPAPAPAARAEDVDDIFGDGVGSDYVCEPNKRQAVEAERERRLAAPSSAFLDEVEQMEEAGGELGAGVPLPLEEEEEEEAGGGGASSLLESVLARSRAACAASTASAPADASDPKKGKGKSKEAKPKGMAMSGGGDDDAYGEYFPDTLGRVNVTGYELGPDSDDEAGIVRGKKEEEEPDADAGGKGGKGGKRGRHDKEKMEAQKAEARMDRELVQIEKLMEERAAKKSRGESLALGNKPKGGGRDRDRAAANEQNEMF